MTGASDGIGAEFCYQLASQGFNLVLIARTESKLKTVAQKCKELNAKVETRILVRDFCRTTSMRFYEDIVQQCSDIDVGFVIANAGIYSAQAYDKASNEVNQDMLDANIYHVSALCHKFLPKLQQRQKQYGVLVVSSGTGYHPSPYTAVYSATKAMVNYLTEGI